MEITEYVEHIRRDGTLLADAAERAGLDAAVPPCPEWQVRDLVRHQGDIHRWAAANLQRDSTDQMPDEESRTHLLTWPDDDSGLLDWFREGHQRLVKAIESAPDDVVAFAFLPAPNARAFWARRQAHETAIHRGDAESATGAVTAYEPEFAADGIDEIMRGFASRSNKLAADQTRTLAIVPTDAATRWFLTMNPDGLSVSSDEGPADCTLAGRASDLYLLLWNRRDITDLEVNGDSAVLDHWRESLKIRWGGPSKKD
jgi:uncharacterized protein (TIGR03083 family)